MTIKAGETAFIDTNVLLCATDRSRPHHDEARSLLRVAREAGYSLALSGQIIREYLVVATRPVQANGLGMSAVESLHNVRIFTPRALLCAETETVSARLRSLIATHALSGKRIHDANVVATMVAHEIHWLITENRDDFAVFGEIQTLGLADLPGQFEPNSE